MPYSLSWQSTGLQNRLSQVRVLHTAPSRRAARTLPGIHAEGEPRYKTERIPICPILTGKEHSTLKREDVSKIIPGITPEQLDSIMNLHGADITAKANEITTLKAEKSTLTEQLNTANGKLEGYDPEWKAKAEQAKTDAASQVAALEKGYALERKASGLKFSSESARKAFLTEAKAQNFAMKDGEIMGFDDYVKTFKAADPSAILPEGSMVQFSASAPGGNRQPANAHEAANAAFRAAFGQKG